MSLRTVGATLALGALALVLVAAGGWLVLVGPARAELSAVRGHVIDTSEANALTALRLRGLEQQADDLGAVTTVADDLAALFPPTADQPGFFALLDEAAAGAGIAPGRVTTLSPTVPLTPPEQDPATAPLAEQSVTVDVEATDLQARRLLARLEEMERSLLVQSVTVTRSSEEGAGATSRLAISGSTFVAPPVTRPELGDGSRTAGR